MDVESPGWRRGLAGTFQLLPRQLIVFDSCHPAGNFFSLCIPTLEGMTFLFLHSFATLPLHPFPEKHSPRQLPSAPMPAQEPVLVKTEQGQAPLGSSAAGVPSVKVPMPATSPKVGPGGAGQVAAESSQAGGIREAGAATVSEGNIDMTDMREALAQAAGTKTAASDAEEQVGKQRCGGKAIRARYAGMLLLSPPGDRALSAYNNGRSPNGRRPREGWLAFGTQAVMLGVYGCGRCKKENRGRKGSRCGQCWISCVSLLIFYAPSA